MINISPRQLQVFVETVAAGSLRAAAERLHLTQPAASMALTEMERLLGGPLFDRVRGRLRLNARGHELLPLARELLERHAEFARAAAGAGGALAGELRIGTSNTVGNYRVGELLGGFVQAAPEVAIRLRVGNTDDIARALLAHELDVACVEGTALPSGLEVLPWRDDALLVCAPPGHPLARRRGLKEADFADAAWVIREPGSATRLLTEQVLGRLPPPRGRLELSQTEAIKQAVAAGLGIALLPEVAVRDALAAGCLCALRTPFLQPFLHRRLSLLLPRGSYRGGLLEAFLRATIA
ncbi:LysR family transcriptional regulator [Thermomonas brevis]|uniref:LysR family transcriptional regulator n=1 Tax=Thermomonas brevis TaxID=215691 RepID=A0A7G9QQM2_9GAMM|nr:LysR family transcriptional regulator [Thermomonas brevis]QNN45647.1 LysR family transcriptional regulator [Thermomonas brevis]